LLPAGSDASAEILTWLAESDQMLRLPRDPQRGLAQRLREFAREEIAWEELDLWAFALEHTEALSLDQTSATPTVTLVREMLGWIEEWQEAEARPTPGRCDELAAILLAERDPARCLARLEQALARP
ncbi:MAG: hypothetical protein ACE5MH_07960, partial [Terriglobia bacterium]